MSFVDEDDGRETCCIFVTEKSWIRRSNTPLPFFPSSICSLFLTTNWVLSAFQKIFWPQMQINAIAKKNNDDEGVREDADEGPLRGVGGV